MFPESLALQADSLPLSHQGSPRKVAAAAAKPCQSCPTLCDPIDGSPRGSSVHGIFQARVLEWVAIAFSDNLSKLKKLLLMSLFTRKEGQPDSKASQHDLGSVLALTLRETSFTIDSDQHVAAWVAWKHSSGSEALTPLIISCMVRLTCVRRHRFKSESLPEGAMKVI